MFVTVTAAAEPQSLPRVLGLFAQRWITPDDVRAQRSGDMIAIRCEVTDIAERELEIIASKLAEMVLVASVEVHASEWTGASGSAADMTALSHHRDLL